MAITTRTPTVTSGSQTTGFTLVINAAVVAGDILILCVTNRGATADPVVVDNDVGGNLWAKLANQNAATNGAGTVWWKRATSATASKTITVSGCTNSASGCVVPFVGAGIGTAPLRGTISEANASANETQAQITTIRPNSHVCLAVFVTSDDATNPTSYTATDPTTLTERAEGVSTGGLDCSASLATNAKTTAGVTGALNWAQTDGTGASIAFELLVSVDALAAAGGSLAETGTAATLKVGRRVSAASGSMAETGTVATLVIGRPLVATSGSCALTGTAAGLTTGRRLSAASGTESVTGTAATLAHGRRLDAASGGVVGTGMAAALVVTHRLDAASGSVAVTGTAAALLVGTRLPAASGAALVTGTDAALSIGRRVLAASGTYAETGTPAGLHGGYRLSTAPGLYAVTGNDVVASVGRVLPAASGAYEVSGIDATLTIGAILDAQATAYVVSGVDAGVFAGRLLSAGSGASTCTGIEAALVVVRQPGGVVAPPTLGGMGSPQRVRVPAPALSRVCDAETGRFALHGGTVRLGYHPAPWRALDAEDEEVLALL